VELSFVHLVTSAGKLRSDENVKSKWDDNKRRDRRRGGCENL